VQKPTSGWSTPARPGSSTDSSCSESGVVEPRRPAPASKERLRLSESGWARARRLRRRWRRWVSVRRSVSLAGPSVACPKSLALARSRWCAPHGDVPRCCTFPPGPRKSPVAASSVARVPPVRRAPCGLASHPAVLRPPSKGPRTCDTGIQERLGSGAGTFQRSEVGAVTRLRLRPRKPPRSGRRPIGS
jgi:hypothetical protein